VLSDVKKVPEFLQKKAGTCRLFVCPGKLQAQKGLQVIVLFLLDFYVQKAELENCWQMVL